MFVCPMILSYSAPKLATDDPVAQRALFDDFKSRFSKSYATADEEALRRSRAAPTRRSSAT